MKTQFLYHSSRFRFFNTVLHTTSNFILKRMHQSSKALLIIVVLFSVSRLIAGEIRPLHPIRHFSLHARVLSEWEEYSTDGDYGKSRERTISGNIRCGGSWIYDSDVAQIHGLLVAETKTTDESYRHSSEWEYPSFHSLEFRNRRNGFDGSLSAMFSSCFYPFARPLMLRMDLQLESLRSRSWNTHREQYHSGMRWYVTHQEDEAWGTDRSFKGGIGIGIGRVRNLWYDMSSFAVSSARVSGTPGLNPFQRELRQRGYAIGFRFAAHSADYRAHLKGYWTEQEFTKDRGYEYSRRPIYGLGGYGTDMVFTEVFAEAHYPFGSRFQVDWYSNCDAHDLIIYSAYDGNLRLSALLSKRWKAEVWFLNRITAADDLNLWYHANVKCHVDPNCELQFRYTYFSDAYYDDNNYRLGMGLTIWFAGQLDFPEVLYPDHIPDWY